MVTTASKWRRSRFNHWSMITCLIIVNRSSNVQYCHHHPFHHHHKCLGSDDGHCQYHVHCHHCSCMINDHHHQVLIRPDDKSRMSGWLNEFCHINVTVSWSFFKKNHQVLKHNNDKCQVAFAGWLNHLLKDDQVFLFPHLMNICLNIIMIIKVGEVWRKCWYYEFVCVSVSVFVCVFVFVFTFVNSISTNDARIWNTSCQSVILAPTCMRSSMTGSSFARWADNM